jgi:integrase/recombinase XerD
MYTEWRDINFVGSAVRVTHKPDRGWTPKAYKKREIPIPTRLVKNLKAWKAKANKNSNLLFPTSGCNPKLNFLDSLKGVAERAKLDPENFWLHKFRATFATRCLRSAHGSTMARSFRYGKHDALYEAIAEPACA